MNKFNLNNVIDDYVNNMINEKLLDILNKEIRYVKSDIDNINTERLFLFNGSYFDKDIYLRFDSDTRTHYGRLLKEYDKLSGKLEVLKKIKKGVSI
jgi:hypothetical protein